MIIHDWAIRGDVPGVLEALEGGVFVDVKEMTSDRTALELACAQPETSTEMLRLLINAGAKASLGMKAAVTLGSIGTVAQLLAIGVGIDEVDDEGQYGSLIHAAYGRSRPGDTTLIPMLEFLIENDAEIDKTSRYGESALRVLSARGSFEGVRLLLDWGANRETLKWTELMVAVALGSLGEVEALLAQGASLTDRDDWKRTPWLLSLQTGNIDKARLLLAAGADRRAVGHCGRTPLLYAVESHDLPMLRSLLAEGFDVNGPNDFSETPLKIAAEWGYADMVAVLLAAGADRERRNHVGERPIKVASSLSVARMLVTESYDLSELGTQAREELLQVRGGAPQATFQQFQAGRSPRYGRSNPERMDIPFWHAMIQSGCNAYHARTLFKGDEKYAEKNNREKIKPGKGWNKKFNAKSEEELETGPGWCYDRLGRSTTLLPDGRIIEVAGEHEDFYDPDFCIYNDVVVFDGRGGCEIYGYPEEVFPPTDFHTATRVGNGLYLIGSVGYMGQRNPEETPVYRLDCSTFKMAQVLTTGTKPGWISRHSARYDTTTHSIQIWGGRCFVSNNSMPHNPHRYALELNRLRWVRLT